MSQVCIHQIQAHRALRQDGRTAEQARHRADLPGVFHCRREAGSEGAHGQVVCRERRGPGCGRPFAVGAQACRRAEQAHPFATHMLSGDQHVDRPLQLQMQRLAAVDRQLLHLAIPNAVDVGSDALGRDGEARCLCFEPHGKGCGRSFQREVQTLERAVAELQLLQACVYF